MKRPMTIVRIPRYKPGQLRFHVRFSNDLDEAWIYDGHSHTPQLYISRQDLDNETFVKYAETIGGIMRRKYKKKVKNK